MAAFDDGKQRFNQQGSRGPNPSSRLQLWLLIFGGAGGVYYVTHRVTIPMSGERRFITLSAAEEKAMGRSAESQILAKHRGRVLPSHHPLHQRIEAILRRLLQSLPATYYAGVVDAWRVYVIDDPEMANAMAAPGGGVFFYTGILKYVSSDDDIASILGHEVCMHRLQFILSNPVDFTCAVETLGSADGCI